MFLLLYYKLKEAWIFKYITTLFFDFKQNSFVFENDFITWILHRLS